MKARDFRAKAWAACKGNWGLVILAMIINAIIVGIAGAIPGVGSLITIVITGPLTLGLTIIFSKLVKGEKLNLLIYLMVSKTLYLHSYYIF